MVPPRYYKTSWGRRVAVYTRDPWGIVTLRRAVSVVLDVNPSARTVGLIVQTDDGRDHTVETYSYEPTTFNETMIAARAFAEDIQSAIA